jgi:hypothetical protein
VTSTKSAQPWAQPGPDGRISVEVQDSIAPLNNESVLSYIGERVLGLPRS